MQKTKKTWPETALGAVGVVSLSIASMTSGGCGSSSESFGAPSVEPIVASAVPTALKSSTSLMVRTQAPAILAGTATDVKTYLTSFFKDTYSGISGTSATGQIASFLKDLDSRVSEINTRSQEGSHACTTAATTSFHVDGTSIATPVDLTLNLSCNDVFSSGGQSGSGSGMVFGKKDGNYSLWLTLMQSNGTDGFGYYANITQPGTDDEAVDLLFLENFPTYSRQRAVRLKTKTTTKAFEMIYGSNTSDLKAATGSTSDVKLGCGFKLISDGTTLYFSGKVLGASDGSTCSSATDVEACLTVSGTSLADAASGACDTLKTTFTISGTTLYSAFSTTTATAITDLLKISNATSTTAF